MFTNKYSILGLSFNRYRDFITLSPKSFNFLSGYPLSVRPIVLIVCWSSSSPKNYDLFKKMLERCPICQPSDVQYLIKSRIRQEVRIAFLPELGLTSPFFSLDSIRSLLRCLVNDAFSTYRLILPEATS